MMRQLPGTLALMLLALLLADELYAISVVPRLNTVQTTPMLWWVVVALPVVVALIVIAGRLRSWTELLVSALAVALLVQVYVVALVLLGLPGTRNTSVHADLALLNGRVFAVSLPCLLIILATIFAIGRLARHDASAG